MSTTTVQLSLSAERKEFIDARVKAGGFGSASDYLHDLLRRDEERLAEAHFAALIQEGLDSPRSDRTWEQHRAELQARIDAAPTAERQKSA